MVCKWADQEEYDHRFWETECGKSFAFTEGGSLSENEFKFCPYCGKEIKMAQKVEEI